MSDCINVHCVFLNIFPSRLDSLSPFSYTPQRPSFIKTWKGPAVSPVFGCSIRRPEFHFGRWPTLALMAPVFYLFFFFFSTEKEGSSDRDQEKSACLIFVVVERKTWTINNKDKKVGKWRERGGLGINSWGDRQRELSRGLPESVGGYLYNSPKVTFRWIFF